MNVLSIISVIISVVRGLEGVFPQGGQGASKLEAARSILSSIYNDLEANWPQVEAAISLVVKIYNAVGTFRKS